MIKNLRVLAVIQARGGSKGIPKKNIYPIGGHPLISYTITAAGKSKYIDKLIVSTDSIEIAAASEKYGALVPFMRPEHLAGDKVASVDSLIHAVLETEAVFSENFDIVVELPCVSPLRTAEDIDGALEKLVSTNATSVISVANTGEKHPVRLKRIVDDKIEDFCAEYPEPAKGSRRQDLEPCFIRNGAIYSMTRETLINKKTRHGNVSRPFLMPEERSVNIDGPFDLKMVEYLIADGCCKNKPKIKLNTTKIIGGEENKENYILITTPLHFLPELKAALEDNKNILIIENASFDNIERYIPNALGWVCSPSPTYQINDKLLRLAKKLRVIASPSTGSNHIDREECERRGISIIALKGSTEVNEIYASSEYTLALLLAAVRRIPQATEAVRAGNWRNIEDNLRGHEMFGKTLGIIGYGRIGSNLSRYANSLGTNITCYDPNHKVKDNWVVQYNNSDEVLAKSDIIVICVHIDKKTIDMVDEKWFSAMKDGVIFINTSRGEIVNEDALVKALEQKKVAYAAVDVVRDEQKEDLSENKLIKYAASNNNLIITPHIAGLTYESEEKAARFAIKKIAKVLKIKVNM